MMFVLIVTLITIYCIVLLNSLYDDKNYQLYLCDLSTFLPIMPSFIILLIFLFFLFTFLPCYSTWTWVHMCTPVPILSRRWGGVSGSGIVLYTRGMIFVIQNLVHIYIWGLERSSTIITYNEIKLVIPTK